MSQQSPAKSKSTALRQISAASRALFVAGVLSLCAGGIITAFLFQTGAGAEIVAVLTIVSGLLCFSLGVMVKRRSTVALIIATILTILSIFYDIGTMIQSGLPASLFLSVVLLSQLYPAFSAMKSLDK